MDQKKYSVIGRLEMVSFPELALSAIEAKIDTGAYTTSIHCHSIEVDKDSDRVACIFLDPEHPDYSGETHSFDIVKTTKVRSSNGIVEKRVIINTEINLLGETFPIRLNLTDRSIMKYPVLIGRRFLRKKFLVDVTLKHQTIAS